MASEEREADDQSRRNKQHDTRRDKFSFHASLNI
jgi:hypothetical protein